MSFTVSLLEGDLEIEATGCHPTCPGVKQSFDSHWLGSGLIGLQVLVRVRRLGPSWNPLGLQLGSGLGMGWSWVRVKTGGPQKKWRDSALASSKLDYV